MSVEAELTGFQKNKELVNSWIASYPSTWHDNNRDSNSDLIKLRRYVESRRIIERKIQIYLEAKKKLRQYTRSKNLYNDISQLDVLSIEHMDKDDELYEEINRTRVLSKHVDIL
ncbi:hypothetical protein BC943DRAFT_337886 [Umbelopsis sp. AD052]|nr:hypothetical protein BC943DRAFT_337886 [Umbelopsis sp. AD052]